MILYDLNNNVINNNFDYKVTNLRMPTKCQALFKTVYLY